MPKIKLMIGDRPYEVACNEGDESHITMLAANLNNRVGRISTNLGTTASESMALVVTALTMEDEIQSLQCGVTPENSDRAVETRINRCIVEVLEPFSERLEALANSLEIE